MAKTIFTCKYPNCNKSLNTLASFRLHRKSHSNKRKIHPNSECPINGCKWQGNQGSLRRHINNNHNA